jgi:hypothetical protein
MAELLKFPDSERIWNANSSPTCLLQDVMAGASALSMQVCSVRLAPWQCGSYSAAGSEHRTSFWFELSSSSSPSSAANGGGDDQVAAFQLSARQQDCPGHRPDECSGPGTPLLNERDWPSVSSLNQAAPKTWCYSFLVSEIENQVPGIYQHSFLNPVFSLLPHALRWTQVCFHPNSAPHKGTLHTHTTHAKKPQGMKTGSPEPSHSQKF